MMWRMVCGTLVVMGLVGCSGVSGAPDYSDPSNWVALPDREDAVDGVPEGSGLSDGQDDALADVFYVHPTTSYALGNAGLVQPELEPVVTRQASPFNGAGRIYAPRYRQAGLLSFGTADTGDYLAVAYADVEAAFEWMLEQEDDERPILLVGHSQGSAHLVRLLKEKFDGQALADRLVAAYLVGEWVGEDTFDSLGACDTPDETGCFVTWTTVSEGGTPTFPCGDASLTDCGAGTVNTTDPVCVNPLSWTRDEEEVAASENPGSLPSGSDLPALEAGLVGGACDGPMLRIDPADVQDYEHEGGDYHPSDIELYWLSVRENAMARVAAHSAR